jgi:hypothetical protein
LKSAEEFGGSVSVAEDLLNGRSSGLNRNLRMVLVCGFFFSFAAFFFVVTFPSALVADGKSKGVEASAFDTVGF